LAEAASRILALVPSLANHLDAEGKPKPGAAGAVAQRNKSLGVKIVSDRYPGDISWTLTDDRSGEVIKSGTREANTRVEEAQPGQSYTLTITDAYGDGFCCRWGKGFAELTWDGAVLAEYKPASSEAFDTKQLTVTIPDDDNTGCLKVGIEPDTYPEDITWELADNITGERVAQGGADGLDCHVTTPGTCYEFRIYDAAGDGLGYGAGNYAVSWAGKEWHSRSHGDYGSHEFTFGICDPDTTVRANQYSQEHQVLLVGHTWEEDDIQAISTKLEDPYCEGDSSCMRSSNNQNGVCYYTLYLDQELDKADLTSAFKEAYGITRFPVVIIGGQPVAQDSVLAMQPTQLISRVEEAGGASGSECHDIFKKLKCIIDTSPVLVIGRSWCGYTKRAINHMVDNNVCSNIIQFDALGDFQTPIYNYLKTKYSYSTTPYLFIGGQHIKDSIGQGGYSAITGNWRGQGGLWADGTMSQMIDDAGGRIEAGCGRITRRNRMDAEGMIVNGRPDASVWWNDYECSYEN